MTKQLSKIPLVRSNKGELLPGDSFYSVVLSSAGTNWRNVVVEEHHFSGVCELGDNLMYMQHVIGVNLGPPIAAEYK